MYIRSQDTQVIYKVNSVYVDGANCTIRCIQDGGITTLLGRYSSVLECNSVMETIYCALENELYAQKETVFEMPPCETIEQRIAAGQSVLLRASIVAVLPRSIKVNVANNILEIGREDIII